LASFLQFCSPRTVKAHTEVAKTLSKRQFLQQCDKPKSAPKESFPLRLKVARFLGKPASISALLDSFGGL
jgi:hypothetical protein